MANRAHLAGTSASHRSKAEIEQRKTVEESLRIGSISNYEPTGLNEAGMTIYQAIVNALPFDRLATVDGYSIERAAANLANVQAIEREIESIGLVEAIEDSKLWVAKHKAEEQARKWLIELGCSPSARAKIANDATATAKKPISARQALESGV